MPELPEVEVVKRSLQKNIKNLTIKKVEIKDNKLRYRIKKKKIELTVNKKIINIKRRSKYLIIELSGGISIIVHFGMTGKFFLSNKKKIKKTSFYYELKDHLSKHNHLVFTLNKKIELIYNDVRKFGFIKIVLTKHINMSSHIKFLGPEPLSSNYNYIYFKKNIINKKTTVKDTLMNQKFVSGLGNIYVNEILFKSKVIPTKKIQLVKNNEILKIIKNTKKILKLAIKKGGSSIKDFRNSEGKLGKFQDKFKVYGRTGMKCMNIDCTGVVKKMILNNRSTFFCNICQK